MEDSTKYGIAVCTDQGNKGYYDESNVINVMYNRDGSSNYTKGTSTTSSIITSVGNAKSSFGVINSEFKKNFINNIFAKYSSAYLSGIDFMGSSTMKNLGYSSDIWNLKGYNSEIFSRNWQSDGGSSVHDWDLYTCCINYATSDGEYSEGLAYFGGQGVDGPDGDSEEWKDIQILCPGLVNAPIYVDGGYEGKGQFKGYIIPEVTLNRCVYFSGNGTETDPYVLQGIGNW